jgi:hypothetical protein
MALACGRKSVAMLQFLQTFVEIALWRKGPQDLPASRVLACAVLFCYVTLEFIEVRLFHWSPTAALLIIGVDILMLTLWLWLVLAFFGRRQRFVQTITATLGVGSLILLLDIVVRAVQLASGFGQELNQGWLLLRLTALALVMGRIFMHALERGLLTGMALTIAIIYSTDEVARIVLLTLKQQSL